MIDSSIDEKVNLKDEFDVSDEGKKLSSLKNVRRNDRSPITNISDDIVNRDFRIEELSNKRERFSNDVSKIKTYKFKLKDILKDGRRLRNRAKFSLEEKICSLLQIYHIKREAWFGGGKLNGVNCRRLMDKNEEIINSIRDLFIEMNKGTVSEDNINIYCNKHKQILIERDNVYRCMRTLTITDALITKIKDHICKTILMWRKLKISVTSSAHLFEDHIVYQMKDIVGGLVDKSEDHIERAHQDGKRSEIKFCGVTNFQQSQISQLKCNDLITNPIVILKSKQIKHETKINLKRKRYYDYKEICKYI